MILRLCANDYHHYCYIDDGFQGRNHFVKGLLHSVQPIALENAPVYRQNRRMWTILDTVNFGKVAQIEIGALLVGGIVNDHENVMMRKGAEMGHFELIGSTIVLLFKKGHIDLLPEIKECIKGDKEVRVIQGQHIANRTVFNRILPKYSRIPLLFTVVLNFSVYWGARAIAGGFIHHNIETSLDDMIPVVYPTVVIYFGCYIFWIIGYLYNAAMDKRHCYRFLMADWLAKAVCFICYVVYPTTNTRPEIVGSDIWAQLMRFLYSMDAADNLFPSIHCLVSWLCYIGIRGNKKYRSGYVQPSVFAL